MSTVLGSLPLGAVGKSKDALAASCKTPGAHTPLTATATATTTTKDAATGTQHDDQDDDTGTHMRTAPSGAGDVDAAGAKEAAIPKDERAASKASDSRVDMCASTTSSPLSILTDAAATSPDDSAAKEEQSRVAQAKPRTSALTLASLLDAARRNNNKKRPLDTTGEPVSIVSSFSSSLSSLLASGQRTVVPSLPTSSVGGDSASTRRSDRVSSSIYSNHNGLSSMSAAGPTADVFWQAPTLAQQQQRQELYSTHHAPAPNGMPSNTMPGPLHALRTPTVTIGAGARRVEDPYSASLASALGTSSRAGGCTTLHGTSAFHPTTKAGVAAQPTEDVAAANNRIVRRAVAENLSAEERTLRRKEQARKYSQQARQRQEAQTKELKEQVATLLVYQDIVENAPDLVMVISPDDQGRILFANAAFARLVHTEPSLLLGLSLWTIVHHDDHPAIAQMMGSMITTTPVPGHVVCRLRNMGGKVGPMVQMAMTMRFGKQGIICFLRQHC